MFEWLGQLAEHVFAIGYSGIYLALIVEGLGLPFPGDAVMVFYGFAAAQGQFHVLPIIGFSVLGYLSGTTLCYWVARRYSAHVRRFGERVPLLNQRSMMRTTRMIDRYGALLLIPGRFLPGVRSVSSYVAGLVDMDFRTFLLYTGIGTVLWCPVWVLIGFWFGENAHAVVRSMQSSAAYVTGALLVVVATVLWLRRTRVH